MPSGGHHTLADLPNELVILSIKFAAASSREFCFSLSFVSSWARDIAQQFLLSTVVLYSPAKTRFFLNYLSKHPKHAAFVVNIWLPTHDRYRLRDVTDLMALLEACHHTVNLSVIGPLLWNAYPEMFNFPHFQERGLRLFIHDHAHTTSRARSRVDATLGLRPDMFNLVTHIHTNYAFFADRGAGIVPHIATFPRLTHLAIDMIPPHPRFNINDFNGVFRCPTLAVLVLVVEPPTDHWHKLEYAHDFYNGIRDRAAEHDFYNGIRDRAAERLSVRVAFGGSMTVFRGSRRGWLDELEGRTRDIWERSIKDTEKWNRISRYY